MTYVGCVMTCVLDLLYLMSLCCCVCWIRGGLCVKFVVTYVLDVW